MGIAWRSLLRSVGNLEATAAVAQVRRRPFAERLGSVSAVGGGCGTLGLAVASERFISKVHVQGYKALRDTTATLSRFTAIVGSNASGKSSLLDAIAFLHACVTASTASSPLYSRAVGESFSADDPIFTFGAADRLEVIETIEPTHLESARRDARPVQAGIRLYSTKARYKLALYASNTPPEAGKLPADGWARATNLIEAVGAAQRQAGFGSAFHLRFDPRILARPSRVTVGIAQLGADGSSLAAVLRDIRDREDGSFALITDAIRRVVPSIHQLRVRKVDAPFEGKPQPAFCIEARIGDSTEAWCPAHELSEGTLLVLATITALYGPGSSVEEHKLVLLDDIDRGLHPRAQRELVTLLRELLSRDANLQILCTTHSPYLIDSFGLEEVVVLKLDDNSHTQAQRLSDHPDAEKWRDLMEAGEFWSSVGEDWVFPP